MSPSPTADLLSEPILLSAPHLTGGERDAITRAIESGWIAPLGPDVDGFESDLCSPPDGFAAALATSSGTAAIHLALLAVGVQAGDTCCAPVSRSSVPPLPSRMSALNRSSLTPASDVESGSRSAELLLWHSSERGAEAGALIAVDLFGQCADYARFSSRVRRVRCCRSRRRRRSPRCHLSRLACGFLRPRIGPVVQWQQDHHHVWWRSDRVRRPSVVEPASFLAKQAQDPARHYEHATLGFNYRMSNVLAALGRAQLAVLDARVAASRRSSSTTDRP